MFRIMLILMSGALFLTGCRQAESLPKGDSKSKDTPAARQPDPVESPHSQAARPAPQGDQESSPHKTGEPKTEIVRALLEALDDVKGESPEAKEEVRRTLLESDEQLAEVLGDNRKRLILEANKKPPMIVVGGPGSPRTEPGPRQKPPTQGRKPTPETSEPGEPQTRIVQALLEALDEAEAKDADKEELRRSLVEADVQLREILGDNRRRMIEKANQKPPVPVVEEPPPPAVPEEGPAPPVAAPGGG